MGTRERREREKDLRRRQIQSAAEQVFLLKGFNSATMEDIADKAELSTGAIYSYFKSKEELYSSLVLIPLSYMHDLMKEVYDNENLPVEKKLLGFKAAMYKTFQTHGLMLRNIMHLQVEDTLATISPELLVEINELSRKVLQMIARVYDDGVSQGKFIPAHNVAVADMFWGLFTGLVMWEEAKRKINPEKDFLRSTLDETFDILIRGVTK